MSVKNVLVVGTGGIGCELIKLLTSQNEIKITLIDFDNIELTNLNRQFYFTKHDIGKFKAEVVGNKIRNITNWDVKVYTDSILNYNLDFFIQFDVVYNCLDNNETRSFVNTRCYIGKVKLVDGGSGGFKGQSCVFDYTKECFDCLPKPVQRTYNFCTIRSIPTKFEHCIEFVKSVIFDNALDFSLFGKFSLNNFYKKFIVKFLLVNREEASKDLPQCLKKDVVKSIKYISTIIRKYGKISDYNKDDKKKVKLLYRLSCIRSKSANIEILNFFDFQSIANNIIPSLCTTNSIVASLMLISEKSNMHYFLTANNKLFMPLEPNEKNKECSVCSKTWIKLVIKKNASVLDLFEYLNEKLGIECKSIMTEEGAVYSFFPYNLQDFLSVGCNTIGTVQTRDEILHLYFYKEDDFFNIVE